RIKQPKRTQMSRIDNLWYRAWSNPGTKIPVGDLVVCDICGLEWTDRPDSGGFLVGDYAYCPECETAFLDPEDKIEEVELLGEKHLIDAYCDPGESFADFVRRMRGPGACIRIERG